MRDRLTAWRVTNVVVFALVQYFNFVGATGRWSGDSIGVVANRYASLFLPANYVFSIWSLIYLGLTAFIIYQAIPSEGSRRVVHAIGPWWAINGALNVAWITLFSFSRFGLALVVMVALLGTLVALAERVRAAAGSALGMAIVVTPFQLYLAWISVALIANTFQFAHAAEWGELGLGETNWSIVMMVVATLLGWAMVVLKRVWPFPLVVAWALWGIGARHAELPALHDVARGLAVVGVLGGLALAWRTASRRASIA
jgi:translocator protein